MTTTLNTYALTLTTSGISLRHVDQSTVVSLCLLY